MDKKIAIIVSIIIVGLCMSYLTLHHIEMESLMRCTKYEFSDSDICNCIDSLGIWTYECE